MKKANTSFFPPGEGKGADKKIQRWLAHIQQERPKLLQWSEDVVGDEDIYGGLIDLSSAYGISLSEILNRLEDWRAAYLPNIGVRAKLRTMGGAWKDIEKKASKALKESERFFDNSSKGHAMEVIKKARLLSKFGLEPQAHRPLDIEIAECKGDIRAFLKRRAVRKVNECGWLLLRAVFLKEWAAGTGKDQIEAFRKIPAPFTGKIKTRKSALRAANSAKVDVARMEAEMNDEKRNT